jgi:uncharacterized ferritin-like protein (DUF455 family)
MFSRTTFGTKRVRGIDVLNDPAREPCFEIVHLHEDVPDDGGMGAEHRRQRLHREYNQEVQSMEVAAMCLTDFPDAPWNLRMELARQCWDEARHAILVYNRLVANGGYKGQFPIANLNWSVVNMIDTLVGRMDIQHRTFEAGSLDIESVAIPMFREAGDGETADSMEVIEADEIQHVRFGNDWVKQFVDENPRSILHIAAAVSWLKKVVAATGGEALHEIPTEREARALAGFSNEDISELERQEQLDNAKLKENTECQ